MKIRRILFITLCLCHFLFRGHAQTTKGSFALGGALKFSSSHNESIRPANPVTTKTKELSFAISPNLSYFVVDRLAAGLITSFSYARYTSGDLQATHSTYSIGPLVRYYFLLGSQWAVFPEVSYQYGRIVSHGPYLVPNNNGDWDLDYYKASGSTRIFQSGVGLTYFLKPTIGIEGKVCYQSHNDSYERGDRTDMIVSSTDKSSVSVTVGVQIYFAKKV